MASPSPQKLAYITFDVFTKTRFMGNPLAIVKVPQSVTLTQADKQKIAREFNYSETVILQENDQELAQNSAIPEWKIGIFLTTAEIPFAGHPTIGTTCYLGAQLQAARGHSESSNYPIHGKVIAKAGPIPFTYDPVLKTSSVEVPQNFHLHEKVLTVNEALFYGLAPTIVENMVRPPAFVSLVKGMTFILVELPSLEILNEVRPGLREVNVDGQLDTEWHPDGTFTAFAFFVRLGKSPNGSSKLRTRVVFGSTEDPATGAASCALTAYLSLFNPDKGDVSGAQKFEITQGVEMGRESHIQLDVTLNASNTHVERLMLGGSAVQVMEGSITL
ncbi:hypothetical protein BGW36DRAFT_303309 [Talaromyces proteolyticus]|uniref:Uncharacterized protein n=1 Tax=Talaromyces proteolyticus TaxID=1131652 RepID=A0AAD4PX17_9EURO|nr:uncharacterized protein BGW36DRAFT_303309 [Talaromyces proteolyticus]KAH8692144.1 hypothetical protein BGW36DRAFT_303309 [Talaromyces proteolyticus]